MRGLLATLLVLAPLTAAEIDRELLEGNDELRARLSRIQGSDQLPPLALDGWLNSPALDWQDLRGRVVVLDFWATWCGTCLASVPETRALIGRWGDRVVLIGVCHPEGSDRLAEVVAQSGIDWPVAIDTAGGVAEAFAVNGYPDYYIIDAEGRIWGADVKNERLEEALQQLLDEAAPLPATEAP